MKTKISFVLLIIGLIGFNVYFGISGDKSTTDQSTINVKSLFTLQKAFAGEIGDECFSKQQEPPVYDSGTCAPGEDEEYWFTETQVWVCVDGYDYEACSDYMTYYAKECDGSTFSDTAYGSSYSCN